QVLDARLVEHVGTDLVTPADIRLVVFQRLGRLAALLHFQFVQFGAQHLHCGVAVGVLGALVLAADYGVGRHVSDTDRRVGGVHVLATRARGTVGVGAQVGRVDVNFNVVIDFRRHEHGGERGMTAVAGIVRAFAHQAVHADLGAQPAVGVLALDVHGGALDTRHFAFGQLHDGGVET